MEIECSSLGAKNNFTVLDLGSYKVRCINFDITKSGQALVRANTEADSFGIKGGGVLNVESASSVISSVISRAEKACEETIDSVFVNVADCGISSKSFSVKTEISSGKVTQETINKLNQIATEKISSIPLHTIRLNCCIDKMQEAIEPIGMYGKNLDADFHVITGAKTMLLNIENCISQCTLKLSGAAFSAYCSAFCSLSDDQKDLGAIAIDIGAKHTSVAFFKKLKCHNVFVLPVGGLNITKDLACGLNLSVAQAEQIKKKFHLIDFDQSSKSDLDSSFLHEIDVKTQISISDASSIILPRLEEIFEIIKEKTKDFNFSSVTITGGGAKVSGVSKVAKNILKKKCRLQERIKVGEKIFGAEYSSLCGMIKIIQSLHTSGKKAEEKDGYIKKFLRVLAFK